MKKKSLVSAAMGLALVSALSMSGCDFDEMTGLNLSDGSTCSWANAESSGILDIVTGTDCTSINNEYASFEARQGSLLSLEDVKHRMSAYPKDYSMAMVLNATAINKLFQAATNWNIGGYDVSLPRIEVGGCRITADDIASGIRKDNCLSFHFEIAVGGYGAKVVFGVPITPVVKGDNPADAEDFKKGLRTAIFADLPKAQIVEIAGKADGSSGSLGTAGSALVEMAVKAIIGDKLKRVSLFDISAWNMGDGNIQLLAGGPVTNEDEGTLTLGMYSNIDLGIPETALGETARVTWEHSFPKNAELGLHIHPDLLRGILGLMLSEGHISSTMEASPNGMTPSKVESFTVSMADMTEYPMQALMTCGEDWQKYFTVGMRMWSRKDVCGYFDILAGLNVNVTDSKFAMGIGNIQAGRAKGIGGLAKLAIDGLTNTQTFKDVMAQATLEFNFDQFDIAAQKDSFDSNTKQVMTDAVDFRIDGNGISLYLNFPDLKLDTMTK